MSSKIRNFFEFSGISRNFRNNNEISKKLGVSKNFRNIYEFSGIFKNFQKSPANLGIFMNF
jgi:hypothetical protein